MKRIIMLLVFLNLLCIENLNATKSVWDGRSSDTSWYNEEFSEYHINSAAQFKGFADLVSYNYCSFEGKTIYLDCDIDLDNHYWSPIGLHSSKPFSGVFNGLNHNITNLLIDGNNFEYPDMKDNVGLFGYAPKAEIRNFSIQGAINVTLGKYIGGVAAFVNKIENIYSDIIVNIQTSLSSSYVGSVVACAEESSKIYSKGEIKFSNSYDVLYNGCYIGGIAGRSSEMNECYSCVELSVNIYGTSSAYVGGISGASTNISNIIFTGSISVSNINYSGEPFVPHIGGICASFWGKGYNIISAPSFFVPGGGWAIGKSIMTPSSSEATISNAYYLNTWATDNEVFGIPISASELKSGSPLSGFDTSIWEFNENEYPSLISLKALIPQPTYTVTYYVDNKLYQVDEYKEGETVTPPADPVKEGYTFDGWGYIPPFISGNSWVVYGTFSINSYVITYMIDDEVFKTETQEYNTYITLPTAYPIKQGYLFYWGEYPDKVPANDVTIVGYYTEDTYEYVDLGLPSGLLWASKNVGAASPKDYGYYFSWGETVLKESYYWGTYKYCNGSGTTLTKYCDSSDFGIVDDLVTLEEEDDAANACWGDTWRLPTQAEAMELYEYCSWSLGTLEGVAGCYVTGPNGNSIFIPNAGNKQYKTKFHQGSEFYLLTSSLYKFDDVHPDYGIMIYCDGSTYGLSGEERGFGFSARAVTKPVVYKLTYIVDGEVNKTYELKEGDYIIPEAEPTKEGYTFSGWSEIPKTMPAKDVTVIGTFTINKYKLVYMIDGEEYKSYEVEFGASIIPETEPTKEGFTFDGWSDIPETMPANDVTIYGSFTTGIRSITINSEGARIYDMQGNRLDSPRKGVNIIKEKDGRARKVVIK